MWVMAGSLAMPFFIYSPFHQQLHNYYTTTSDRFAAPSVDVDNYEETFPDNFVHDKQETPNMEPE